MSIATGARELSLLFGEAARERRRDPRSMTASMELPAVAGAEMLEELAACCSNIEAAHLLLSSHRVS